MRKRFDFVSDPSHGWLKVPVSELVRLGITDQISTYSYIKGDMAYLEEDRDMKVFLDARTAAGEGDIRMIEHVRNRDSRIRKYDAFDSSAFAPEAPAEEDEATITEIGTLEPTETPVADDAAETAEA